MEAKGVCRWRRWWCKTHRRVLTHHRDWIFIPVTLVLLFVAQSVPARVVHLKPVIQSADDPSRRSFRKTPGDGIEWPDQVFIVAAKENTGTPFSLKLQLFDGASRSPGIAIPNRPTRMPVLTRAANGGYIDDRWVRDATVWTCLPGCVETGNENSVSIATGETISGSLPKLWAVTDFLDTSLSPNRRAILIAYSTDAGSTWNWFAKIYDTNGFNLINPDLAVDVSANPDRLYLTYELETSATNHDVCFAGLNEDGTSFVAACTAFPVNETNPRIAVERNQAPNYAVVTYEYHASASSTWIVVFRSTDQGSSWNGILLDLIGTADPRPDITCGVDTAGSSYCHLSFINPRGPNPDRLFYSKALRGDLLEFFLNEKWIATLGDGELQDAAPVIMATNGGGRIVVATDYIDTTGGGDYDLLIATSEDNGQNFSSTSLDLPDNQRYPSLATENYAQTAVDNTRNIFWLTYWTGTVSPGHVSMATLTSPYTTAVIDTPDPYVDDDGLVPLQVHGQAVTDVQNDYGGVTFLREGTTLDQYYGTKGDQYSFDTRLKGTTLHIDVPLTIDGTSYVTPIGPFAWPAFGVHTVSATGFGDDGSWHYNFDSWSDGGAQTHDIVAEYAQIAQPPPQTDRYAYYTRCTLTPPEVGTMFCTKGASGAVQCSWSPLGPEDADDYAVLRATAKAPSTAFSEIMRTGGRLSSQFVDTSATGSSIFYYLVQAVCGSGSHDHRGPTGYNGP